MSSLGLNPKETFYDCLLSPVGKLHIFSSDRKLKAIFFDNPQKLKKKELKGFRDGFSHLVIEAVKSQLEEYFSGQRRKFELPLDPEGTEFQKQAWKALRKIPYGRTFSYQEQAKKLGDVNKARAVGQANSQNPISIVVPCHRVISKNGSLNGFGGGVDRKKFLLDLERS